MSESEIPVGATGESLRTFEQSIGGNQRHTEAVAIADPVDTDQVGRVVAGVAERDASAQVVEVKGLPSGTPSYEAGTSGTVSVPDGALVVGMTAHTTTGGTLTIDGGDSIPIPANSVFVDDLPLWAGPLDLIFTGTDSYYVRWVS